jgi:hypothetical protein
MRTAIAFLTGSLFTLALLTRCSVPNASAGGGGDVADAGGGGGSGSAVYRSGSRLKLKVTETPDGLRMPAGGFYDSELGIDCERDNNQFGTPRRCVPGFMGSGSFTDSDCTQKRWPCDPGDGKRYYAYDYDTKTLLGFGRRIAEDAPVYTKSGNGSCVLLPKREPVCERGEEVPGGLSIFAPLEPLTTTVVE